MTGKEIVEFNDLLATERRWSKEYECVTVWGSRCPLNSSDAYAFSLDGALLLVVGPDRLYAEALKLVMCLGPGEPVDPDNALTVLMDFNDTTTMRWKNLKARLINLVATG